MSKDENQQLWESGIVEATVIQTIIDGLRLTGKDSITIEELEHLITKGDKG